MDGKEWLRNMTTIVLSLASVSLLHYFDPLMPITYFSLVSPAVLFGYTSFISQEEFRQSSVSSIVLLPFLTFGGIYTIFSVIVPVSNISLSYFTSGNSFNDYYRSSSTPLLISGVLMSLIFSAALYSSPAFNQGVENATVTFMATGAQTLVDQTRIAEGQKESKLEMIEYVSRASVDLAGGQIINQTESNLSDKDLMMVKQAYYVARDDVPPKMVEEANSSLIKERNVKDSAEALVRDVISNKKIFLMAPAVLVAVYSLHPVVGILTAFIAVLIRELSSFRSS